MHWAVKVVSGWEHLTSVCCQPLGTAACAVCAVEVSKVLALSRDASILKEGMEGWGVEFPVD